MGHANDDVGRVPEREHASGDIQEGLEMGHANDVGRELEMEHANEEAQGGLRDHHLERTLRTKRGRSPAAVRKDKRDGYGADERDQRRGDETVRERGDESAHERGDERDELEMGLENDGVPRELETGLENDGVGKVLEVQHEGVGVFQHELVIDQEWMVGEEMDQERVVENGGQWSEQLRVVEEGQWKQHERRRHWRVHASVVHEM